jgi:hypothetical protein
LKSYQHFLFTFILTLFFVQEMKAAICVSEMSDAFFESMGKIELGKLVDVSDISQIKDKRLATFLDNFAAKVPLDQRGSFLEFTQKLSELKKSDPDLVEQYLLSISKNFTKEKGGVITPKKLSYPYLLTVKEGSLESHLLGFIDSDHLSAYKRGRENTELKQAANAKLATAGKKIATLEEAEAALISVFKQNMSPLSGRSELVDRILKRFFADSQVRTPKELIEFAEKLKTMEKENPLELSLLLENFFDQSIRLTNSGKLIPRVYSLEHFLTQYKSVDGVIEGLKVKNIPPEIYKYGDQIDSEGLFVLATYGRDTADLKRFPVIDAEEVRKGSAAQQSLHNLVTNNGRGTTEIERDLFLSDGWEYHLGRNSGSPTVVRSNGDTRTYSWATNPSENVKGRFNPNAPRVAISNYNGAPGAMEVFAKDKNGNWIPFVYEKIGTSKGNRTHWAMRKIVKVHGGKKNISVPQGCKECHMRMRQKPDGTMEEYLSPLPHKGLVKGEDGEWATPLEFNNSELRRHYGLDDKKDIDELEINGLINDMRESMLFDQNPALKQEMISNGLHPRDGF